MIRTQIAGIGTIVAGLLAAIGAPEETYLITPLKISNHITSAFDINNAGTVLVKAGDGTGTPYIYKDGEFESYPVFGWETTHASALNEKGVAVGFATEVGSKTERAVIFGMGGTIDLSLLLPGRPRSLAQGINNRGTVVGYYHRNSDDVQRAFVYDGENAIDLEISPSGIARNINDLGQIVGFERDDLNHLRGYVWSEGTRTLLPSLGGIRTSASAINNRGQVAGNSQLIPNVSPGHAFLFNQGDPNLLDLGALLAGSQASDINRFGEVVGVNQNDDNTERRAYIHTKGSMIDLNGVVANSSDWTLEVAHAINDYGQIVGQGTLDGVSTAFLLTPSSSPRIDMYAGITILGSPGDRFQVEYRESVGSEDTWATLATVELTGTIYRYFDEQSPFVPKRFYRVVLLP